MSKGKAKYIKIRVVVTEEHIKCGSPCSSTLCPIVLALLDRGLKNVWINGYIEFTKGAKSYFAHIPKKAHDFINKFDEGKAVAPFVFGIEAWDISEGEPKDFHKNV